MNKRRERRQGARGRSAGAAAYTAVREGERALLCSRSEQAHAKAHAASVGREHRPRAPCRAPQLNQRRSEERRVGQAWVRMCNTRVSPYDIKKQHLTRTMNRYR